MATGSPSDIADLSPELRSIFNEWDPIGYAGLDGDGHEYDGLNGSVLGWLASGDDLATFSQKFARATSFGGSVEARDRMATKLFIWFHSKGPPGDAEELGVENRPQLRKGRRWRSSHWKR